MAARTLLAVAAAAAAASAGSASAIRFPHAPTASFSLSINVTRLSVPAAPAVVSWNAVRGAGKGDWIGVNCAPSSDYYWCA
jgi:hypothetical protein